MSTHDEPVEAKLLRDRMADGVIANRAIIHAPLPPNIEAALRAVPRHLFLPDLDLEAAYAEDAPVMKRDELGVAISSVSAPSIMAMALDQARIRPGQRVLEIGSGGYFAALLTELVGTDGHVTTMDIDPDVTARATSTLKAAGYGDQVTVVTSDGEYGRCGEEFDRIIVTVGAADIPPAWLEQLVEGGRLVVPLRIRGLTRSVVFERSGDRLIGGGYEICGFVAMQGAGQSDQCLIGVHDAGVSLRVDDRQPVEADALRRAMAMSPVEIWAPVTVARMEPFDDVDLWIATMAASYARLTATSHAIDAGVARPVNRLGSSCIFDADSFAYLTARPTSIEDQYEFGAVGYGPHARPLAERLVQHLTSWDSTHRHGPKPHIDAYPRTTPDTDLPTGALVVEKPHTRLTISWPR